MRKRMKKTEIEERRRTEAREIERVRSRMKD